MIKRAVFVASLFALVLGSTVAFAQDPNKVLVDKSMLTADQLAKVQTTQVVEQAKDVGVLVGLGKEIGDAVHFGLSALGSDIDKVANTKAGQFTMWMIAYKVVGGKLIRVVISFLLGLVLIPTFIWAFRNNGSVHSVMVSEEYDPATKKRLRRYQTYEPTSESKAAYGLIPLVVIIILIIIVVA